MLDVETIRALVANGETSIAMARQFNTSPRTVQQFVKNNNLGPWVSRTKTLTARQPRPMPDDFKTVAVQMTCRSIERHYQCRNTTAKRWLKEAGFTPPKLSGKQIVAPDNLADLVKDKKIKEIAQELGVGRDAVRRMVRNAGLQKERIAPVQKLRRNVLPFKPMGSPTAAKETYNRDMSRVGLAVEYLKTLGPVYRRGDMWMRGNTLMSDAQIIERADEIRERDARRCANRPAILQRYGS